MSERQQKILRQFDSLPNSANVRRAVVGQLFGISPSTVSKWAEAGLLPPPMPMGKFHLWNVGSLRETIALKSGQEAVQ